MSTLPCVAAVIVNYNGKKDTLNCLRSLTESEYPNLEFLVIENCSSIKEEGITPADLVEFPRVHFEKSEYNSGFSGGMNLGMTKAIENGCRYALILNNDAVVEPRCVSELVETAEHNLDTACVSPLIFEMGEPKMVQYAGGRIGKLTRQHRYSKTTPCDSQDGPYETELCTGAAMLVRLDCVARLGGFDEDLFLQSEDADFSLRMRSKGFRLLVEPRAHVRHRIGGSMGRRMSSVMVFFAVRNYFIVTKRHSTKFEFTLASFVFGAAYLPILIATFVLTNRSSLVRPLVLAIMWHIGYHKNDPNHRFVANLSAKQG
ncbi:glycosyltransferase family 2 protein [Candidatus Bathyarchaeota archaeon]|nr:glycosyltransferase family 2 protein [Candidatus Bathyarchaeota archaeon]